MCRTIAEIREYRAQFQKDNQSVGLVPTMGFLHAAHLSLVELAQKRADRSVVSIFVNPSQFNQRADLESYPRDEARDLALLQEAGVDLVFCPTVEEMYPNGFQSWVQVEEISLPWEGAGRPGHFRGVATVCTMLFQIVQPDIAVFGEKDFQQLRLIEQMVADLKIPTTIVRGPLIREEDGLAMSSRNVRLSRSGREKALHISRTLHRLRDDLLQETTDRKRLLQDARSELERLPDVAVDYLSIVQENDLSEADGTYTDEPERVIATVVVDGVRLLDNVSLKRKALVG